MSEEMKKLFWELKQYLVPYSPNWYALCETEQYILNLEQENKNLKEQLKGTTHCYDEEEHKELSKKLLNKTTINITLKKDRDYWQGIVNEFEKYLKEKINFYKISRQGFSYEFCKEIYDKLQKLKGLNNE